MPLTANGKVDRQALARIGVAGPEQQASSGAAPVDELERSIAEVWQTLLRVPAVGRDQGFFELGGDSLLVAQVVGRLREALPQARQLPWSDLLRQLINQPTVAALADYLRGQGVEGDSPLVRISDKAQGPTRIFVHDGSGTLAPYRALFAALGEEAPLEGLVLNDVPAYLALEPATAIRQLAERYADTLQAEGRRQVSIVGYCLGGLLATELAACLAARSIEVLQLSVISSYRVPFMIEDDLLAEYVFARVMQADPLALGTPRMNRPWNAPSPGCWRRLRGASPQGSLLALSDGCPVRPGPGLPAASGTQDPGAAPAGHCRGHAPRRLATERPALAARAVAGIAPQPGRGSPARGHAVPGRHAVHSPERRGAGAARHAP